MSGLKVQDLWHRVSGCYLTLHKTVPPYSAAASNVWKLTDPEDENTKGLQKFKSY